MAIITIIQELFRTKHYRFIYYHDFNDYSCAKTRLREFVNPKPTYPFSVSRFFKEIIFYMNLDVSNLSFEIFLSHILCASFISFSFSNAIGSTLFITLSPTDLPFICLSLTKTLPIRAVLSIRFTLPRKIRLLLYLFLLLPYKLKDPHFYDWYPLHTFITVLHSADT